MKNNILPYNEVANADHILNRLKKGLNLNSDKYLAELFNIPKSTLSNWRSRNNMDYHKLFLICNQHEISLDWVISAKGPLKIIKSINIDLLQDMLNVAIHDLQQLKVQKVREEIKDLKTKSFSSDQLLSEKSNSPDVLDEKIALKLRDIEQLQRKN